MMIFLTGSKLFQGRGKKAWFEYHAASVMARERSKMVAKRSIPPLI